MPTPLNTPVLTLQIGLPDSEGNCESYFILGPEEGEVKNVEGWMLEATAAGINRLREVLGQLERAVLTRTIEADRSRRAQAERAAKVIPFPGREES